MAAEPGVRRFIETTPTTDSYWRAVILFGRNVASYKLALGKSLLELSDGTSEVISLQDLAVPFSRHLCEHLRVVDRQTTSPKSTFLDACRARNRGEISDETLVEATIRLGFNNVIDAFHVVNQAEIPNRFFVDERRTAARGIRLTENIESLREVTDFADLNHEVEARWALVETSWELGIPGSVLAVDYVPQDELLVARTGKIRRRSITGVRGALNGYQKGRCFYCRAEHHADRMHVDHFMPFTLMVRSLLPNLDAVWNLTLACPTCNGAGEKGACAPDISLLERLYERNEYLVASNLPLRETLIRQTGPTKEARRAFLQAAWNVAHNSLIHTWAPPAQLGTPL